MANEKVENIYGAKCFLHEIVGLVALSITFLKFLGITHFEYYQNILAAVSLGVLTILTLMYMIHAIKVYDHIWNFTTNIIFSMSLVSVVLGMSMTMLYIRSETLYISPLDLTIAVTTEVLVLAISVIIAKEVQRASVVPDERKRKPLSATDISKMSEDELQSY